jgi:HlyD family secretion protein
MRPIPRKIAGVSLLLVLCLLPAGFGCAGGEQAGPEAIFVSGRIEGDEANIAPKMSGRVVEVVVREGATVRRGDVLVRLSGKQTLASRDEAAARVSVAERRFEQAGQQVGVLEARLKQLQLQEGQAGLQAQGRVAQAEGQLAAARAELVRAQADLEQNTADATRYAGLAQKGAVPQQQAEQFATKVSTSQALVEAAGKQVGAAEGALAVARASLDDPKIRAAEIVSLRRQIEEAKTNARSVRAEVTASEAFLSRLDADVEDLEVTAPFDGIIITRAAEPGQVVNAGTTLLTMVDPRQLYLRGFIPEGQIGHVKVGQRVEVFLDSSPETAIPAEVMRIDPEAMFTPENTYFKEDRVKQVVGVKILLKGGYGNAKLGMPADGNILIDAPAAQGEQ